MNEKNGDEAYEKNNMDDDLMLPGFRFHPTDEELVGFYLKKKLQQKTLPMELIKQVDIYKYDPWDLPNLAHSGEKEWYFYCPRDRKYRNSTRPNRVTGSGFWKATGTDRPIYSSNNRCIIGLKKSLVFYRGKAAKGTKTDWMMHEFRLPDGSAASPHPSVANNDSWAICRIFKKANSAANRALCHPWMISAASMSETEDFTYNSPQHHQSLLSLVSPDSNLSSIPKHDLQTTYFSALNIPGNSVMSSDFDGLPPQRQLNGFSLNPYRDMQTSVSVEEGHDEGLRKNQHKTMNASYLRSVGFPFDFQSNGLQEQPSFSWDDSPPTCPSEFSSTTHSTNNLYT